MQLCPGGHREVGPEGSQFLEMQVEGAERQRLRRWEMGTTDPGFKVGWAGRGGTVGAVGSGRKHGGS